VLQDGTGLLQGNTRKPLKEISELRPVFKVFKQGRHGNSCTSKHPSAADPLGVALYCRTRRPVNHEPMLHLLIEHFNAAATSSSVLIPWWRKTPQGNRVGELAARGRQRHRGLCTWHSTESWGAASV
jgi:hypothetical protein